MIHKNHYVVITIDNKYTIATTQVYISRWIMTCYLKQHHCYYQRASKSPNTGPMGSCVSMLQYSRYPISSKSISFHNWFLDNNTVDGHTSYPSLTSISDNGVRTVEKLTKRLLYVVVFCTLVKERVNSYRYSISWIPCLCLQHW